MPASLSYTEGILDFLPHPPHRKLATSALFAHCSFNDCIFNFIVSGPLHNCYSTPAWPAPVYMLLDSGVFELSRSCLIRCYFEGKLRQNSKLWKKQKEKGSSGDDTINHELTKFIHPFPVSYRLFGFCPWTAWTVCQSYTHRVIYYNIRVQIITLPRMP